MSSKKYRLDLSFVGTPFKGWQSQAGGGTVQDLITDALEAIGHEGKRPVGCSRTDAGVHARAFTAHVACTFDRSPEAVLRGLNANLPPEIRVFGVRVLRVSFHARYDAASKAYRYFVYRDPVVPPPLHPFVSHWCGALHRQALEEAAAFFEGEHDYSAFTTAEGRKRETRRTVDRCAWTFGDALWTLEVRGRSFLHRQVRCMAGALLGVGSGRIDAGSLETALSGGEAPPFPALPGRGLTLWDVQYPHAEYEEEYDSGMVPEGWPG